MSFRYLRLDKIYYKLDKVWLLYECVYYGKMKAVKGGGCMEHITVGRKKNTSKVALVECVKNGSLNNIDIKVYFKSNNITKAFITKNRNATKIETYILED